MVEGKALSLCGAATEPWVHTGGPLLSFSTEMKESVPPRCIASDGGCQRVRLCEHRGLRVYHVVCAVCTACVSTQDAPWCVADVCIEQSSAMLPF